LEFWASGRRWDLEAVVEALAIDPSSSSQEPTELAPVHVADDVVLLTYRIDGQDGASLRSSLWVREGGSWCLRFHQALRRYRKLILATRIRPGAVTSYR
jgi:ribonuclease HI